MPYFMLCYYSMYRITLNLNVESWVFITACIFWPHMIRLTKWWVAIFKYLTPTGFYHTFLGHFSENITFGYHCFPENSTLSLTV